MNYRHAKHVNPEFGTETAEVLAVWSDREGLMSFFVEAQGFHPEDGTRTNKETFTTVIHAWGRNSELENKREALQKINEVIWVLHAASVSDDPRFKPQPTDPDYTWLFDWSELFPEWHLRFDTTTGQYIEATQE